MMMMTMMMSRLLLGCQREMCYTRRRIASMFRSRVEFLLTGQFAHDVFIDSGILRTAQRTAHFRLAGFVERPIVRTRVGPLAGGVIILAYMIRRFHVRTIDPSDEWSTRRIRANLSPKPFFVE